MSPSCQDGAHQPKMVCPRCEVKAITKTGIYLQCCSKYGGCGYGGFDEKEFGGQKTLFDKPEAEGQSRLSG